MIFIFFDKIIKNYYNLKIIHFFIKIYHTYSFKVSFKNFFYKKKVKKKGNINYMKNNL